MECKKNLRVKIKVITINKKLLFFKMEKYNVIFFEFKFSFGLLILFYGYLFPFNHKLLIFYLFLLFLLNYPYNRLVAN